MVQPLQDFQLRWQMENSTDFWPREDLETHKLGPPVVPFYPFLGEGSPSTTTTEKRVPLF